jgi:hypothetical protein
MTLHPTTPRPEDGHLGEMRCARCGVGGHEDPTVYARITIEGHRQAPLCTTCATKMDRMARLARREAVA